MKIINLFLRFLFLVVLISLISCQSNPTNKIQGVFKADKGSLKEMAKENMGNETAFADALLAKVIQNSVIEFKINGNSISGLMFFAGQTTIIDSEIVVRNDSMFAKSEDSDYYLSPNEKGLLLKGINSKLGIQLVKSEQSDLSSDTKTALKKAGSEAELLKEFKDNLGLWYKGNVVDEFGDQTGETFPVTIVSGEHENSSIINSDVFVKATIDKNGLYFQIVNSRLTLNKNLPNREFGTIKIKFPDGEVKTEEVFFFNNTISESIDSEKPLIYDHLINESGELKILIDVGTASRYYCDKYRFNISQSNLNEILAK